MKKILLIGSIIMVILAAVIVVNNNEEDMTSNYAMEYFLDNYDSFDVDVIDEGNLLVSVYYDNDEITAMEINRKEDGLLIVGAYATCLDDGTPAYDYYMTTEELSEHDNETLKSIVTEMKLAFGEAL